MAAAAKAGIGSIGMAAGIFSAIQWMLQLTAVVLIVLSLKSKKQH
jgi:hypothetical protein